MIKGFLRIAYLRIEMVLPMEVELCKEKYPFHLKRRIQLLERQLIFMISERPIKA